MNNDRFLTRVFDKQEKKMLYSKPEAFEDDYEYTTIATIAGHKLDYRLIGVNGDFINFVTKQNVWLPYHNEDRFVPMTCTGFREDYGYENVEDGMPAFEFDIIQSHMSELFLIILKDGCWVANLIRNRKIINRPICDLASLKGRFSIKGNKFENQKLMEVKA